jgi:hypothetical protein
MISEQLPLGTMERVQTRIRLGSILRLHRKVLKTKEESSVNANSKQP